MFTMPTAPRTIGGVLDDTFQLFRQSFWALWPLSVLGFVVTVAAVGFASWRMLADISRGDPQTVLAAFTSLGFLASVVLAVLVSIWFYSAQLLRAHAIAQGESLSFGAALGRGLSITPAMVLASIVYLLMIAVSSMLPFVAGALMPGFWAKLVAALILCVPFLFLSVTYYFFFVAIAVDDAGPFAGLGRSRQLVRGNWWRATAVITVGFIILFVVYFAAGLIAELLALPVRDVIANAIVGMILNGLLTSVVAPMLPVLSIAIYYDLKLRRFGGDLAQRVDSLA